MQQYHEMLEYVLENGEEREDRTGTGTISVFGYQNEYDINETFPVITTKKLYWNGVVTELLWFLKGDTNVKYLQDHNVNIWNEWADENGNLGPVYGKQWRVVGQFDDTFGDYDGYVDQISTVINSIKNNPTSRRHIVSAWNVGELHKMALPPCHLLFQFYVRKGEYLDCHLYQRSADAFLGVPFNIASYSLLTYMIAQVCGLKPGRFIHSFGDLHIYKNHADQVKEQLSREHYSQPTLKLNTNIEDIYDFTHDDIGLEDYKSHPTIKAPVAV